MSERQFLNRVAVVTGAASGIGFGIAQRFAEEGARVALLDRDEDRGQATADEIKAGGGICEFYRTDVGVEAEVIRTLDEVVTAFHGLDHLVNNAGTVSVMGIEECTVEEWDRVININLRSIFLTTKYSLRSLRSSRYPTIVNVGSVSSFVAQTGTPAYVASKGGVLMLSKALALDLAPDRIRVNCVCPGITDTPMFRFHVNATADPERTLRERFSRVPLGRPLSPREIADAVLYLSSNQSSGITGTSLVVDAGYTAAAEWSKE
jgi:NAD(P)-dependent dehydrogenase (short-subunit alcohol dehydrogenase family)